MAKKKKPAKKRKTARKKNNSVIKELKKIVLGIIILVFIAVTIAMVADIYINQVHDNKKTEQIKEKKPAHKAVKPQQPKPEKSVPAKPEKKPESTPDEHKVRFEVFDDDVSSIPSAAKIKKPVVVKPVIKKNGLPLVAIIIDDIGYHRRNARTLAKLDNNITFSVLPFSPHGRELAVELHNSGHQIMLHLPMEPVEYPKVNPGPGSLLSAMTPDQLLEQLRKDLDAVPFIVGVNNHMGSRLTPMSAKMNQVFTILKKRDLFFIDSITSGRTKCASSASLLRLDFGQRDIFIDNIQESEYIMGQIRQLIRKAKKHGAAIGIAHPYGATAETLRKNISWIKKRVQLVPASTLTAKVSG